MGWVGLEPTTNALKGRCSTIELPTPSGERFNPVRKMPQDTAVSLSFRRGVELFKTFRGKFRLRIIQTALDA